MSRVANIIVVIAVLTGVVLFVSDAGSSAQEDVELYATALDFARIRLPDIDESASLPVDIPVEQSRRLKADLYQRLIQDLGQRYQAGRIGERCSEFGRIHSGVFRGAPECTTPPRDVAGKLILYRAQLDGNVARVTVGTVQRTSMGSLPGRVYLRLEHQDGVWEVVKWAVEEY